MNHYLTFQSTEQAHVVMDQLKAEPHMKRFIDGLASAKTFRRSKNDGLFTNEAEYLVNAVYAGELDLIDLIDTAYNLGYRRGYQQADRNHRKGARI